MEPAYRQNVWTVQKGSEYTIANGYEFLQNKNDKVSWAKFVWNNMTIPKHSIIAWLYHHNALNTQKKLQRLGITGENTCFICGSGVETEDQLFFQCVYSTQVIVRIWEWLEINIPCTNITDWRTRMMGSSKRQALLNATINACMYHLWRTRNHCKFEFQLERPWKVAANIKGELSLWFLSMMKTEKSIDKDWIKRIYGRIN
ncbi:uncharacterized protein LOC141648959 [Silene latifolia]|uniref:uncharacterized protein LOC141648959 n=1 Tax=Silene latifolia TaxID=37657 RepID=UPI003D774EBA